MKVKTNVLVNGPHVGEDIEEWINELAAEGLHLVSLTITERPDEPMRVIARGVFEDAKPGVAALLIMAQENATMLAELRAQVEKVELDSKHAHEEVGALVSVLLEVHKAAVDPTTTDYARVTLVKTALSRCIEDRVGGGTVVNLAKLLRG